ncbi:MAG: SRPBCC domain-containing protein [Gemmatimonadetes bacterium]|nr:SRPBCC domain-containing protein [Gemmatimonadota bacterium]
MTTVMDESPDSASVRLFAELAGPPEAVFAFFTEPERLTRWWPAAAVADVRPGGAYHFSWPQMDWHLRGEYTVVEPPRALEFTWAWDHEPQLPVRTVRVELAPDGGGTRVTVTQGTYGSSPAEQEDRNSHIAGWTHFLGELSATLTGDGARR